MNISSKYISSINTYALLSKCLIYLFLLNLLHDSIVKFSGLKQCL